MNLNADGFLVDEKDIKSWLDSVGVKNYEIRYDNERSINVVDIFGSPSQEISLSHGKLGDLSQLPAQFGVVVGEFYVNNNNLTTYKGCPDLVTEFFGDNNPIKKYEKFPLVKGGLVSTYHDIDKNKDIQIVGSSKINEVFSSLIQQELQANEIAFRDDQLLTLAVSAYYDSVRFERSDYVAGMTINERYQEFVPNASVDRYEEILKLVNDNSYIFTTPSANQVFQLVADELSIDDSIGFDFDKNQTLFSHIGKIESLAVDLLPMSTFDNERYLSAIDGDSRDSAGQIMNYAELVLNVNCHSFEEVSEFSKTLSSLYGDSILSFDKDKNIVFHDNVSDGDKFKALLASSETMHEHLSAKSVYSIAKNEGFGRGAELLVNAVGFYGKSIDSKELLSLYGYNRTEELMKDWQDVYHEYPQYYAAFEVKESELIDLLNRSCFSEYVDYINSAFEDQIGLDVDWKKVGSSYEAVVNLGELSDYPEAIKLHLSKNGLMIKDQSGEIVFDRDDARWLYNDVLKQKSVGIE